MASNGKHWTEEETEQLIELCDQGLSAAQCARVLGRTQNAVSGKITLIRKRAKEAEGYFTVSPLFELAVSRPWSLHANNQNN